ncbi:hypothetical protein [Salinactinospora qingdaonensis]|uniref:hypothetical protein n=1 Tax=Salinactinospora qingdaonensis TaxID=702744 RepID=UPI0031E517A1
MVVIAEDKMETTPSLSIEPESNRFLWLSIRPMLFLGVGFSVVAALDGLRWDYSVIAALSLVVLVGIRYPFWVFFYRRNRFFLSVDGVVLRKRRKLEEIPLSGVVAVRLSCPDKSPEWGDFFLRSNSNWPVVGKESSSSVSSLKR